MTYSYEANSYYLYDYYWFDCSDSLDELNTAVTCGDHTAVKSKAVLNNDAVERLSTSLAQNQNLKALCLYCANVGADGALHLAKALRSNSILSLQTLDLRGSGVGDRGVQHLASALKTNRTVEYLDLFSNDISDIGAVHLAEMLGVNRTLLYFWCENNGIGEEGTIALAQSLKHQQSSLVAFSLHGNPYSTKGYKALIEAIAENNTLLMLWASNGTASELDTEMYDAMAHNTTLLQLNAASLCNGVIAALLDRNKRLLKSEAVRRLTTSELTITAANVLMVHTSSSLDYPKDYVLGAFNPPGDNSGIAIVKIMHNEEETKEVELGKSSGLCKDFLECVVSGVKLDKPNRSIQRCGCCWGKIGETFQALKGEPQFRVNDRIQCLWVDSNTLYPGRISKKSEDKYDVNYDDGDFEANAKARKIYHAPHKDIEEGQDNEEALKNCGVSLNDLLTPKRMATRSEWKNTSLFTTYHISRQTSDQHLVQIIGEDFNYACVVINLDLLHSDPVGETYRMQEELETLRFFSSLTHVFIVGMPKEGSNVRKGDHASLSDALKPMFATFTCLQWNAQDNLAFFSDKRSVWNALLNVIPSSRFTPTVLASVEKAAEHLSRGSKYVSFSHLDTFCRDEDIKRPESLVQVLQLSGYTQMNPWTHGLRKAMVDVNMLHRMLHRLHHFVKSIQTYGTANLEARFEKVGLQADLQRLKKTSVATLDILRAVWDFRSSDAPSSRGFREKDPVACMLPLARVLMGHVAAVNEDGSYEIVADGTPNARKRMEADIVRGYTNRGAYAVNDYVICTWGADHTYYQAHVAAVHGSTSYDVAFDDGDFEANVNPSRIRLIEEQPPLVKAIQPNWYARVVPQLIDMMLFKLLIHPWQGTASRHEEAYFIPPDPSVTVPLSKRTDPQAFSSVHFDFHQGGIPRCVFYRVAASLHNFLAEAASSTLMLYSDYAELQISPKRSVYLELKDSVMTLFVKNDIDGSTALNLTTAQLKKINGDHLKRHPLRYRAWCEDANGNGKQLSLSEAQLQKIKPWFDSVEHGLNAEAAANFL